jgi:SAM-dependent methyltransferase
VAAWALTLLAVPATLACSPRAQPPARPPVDAKAPHAANHCPAHDHAAHEGEPDAHAHHHEPSECPHPEAHPPEHHAKHHPEHSGHHGDGAHTAEKHADHTCPTADHRFDDPEKWAKIFDDPARDAWQKPGVVVSALALKPNASVADVGTGTGYFLPHLAKAVPQGRVWAIDVEPRLLDHVKKRAAAAKLTNVQTILADKDDPKLADGTDVVLLVDTYHHLGKRMDYFRAVQPKLAPKGRVVIVDFRMGKLPVGPPDSHKLPPQTVKQEMQAAGYALCSDQDILPHQYVLTFARPGQCP